MDVLVDQREYHTTLTIKKSVFKVYAKKTTTKNEVTDFLNIYQDAKATHNCYAYKLRNKTI